MSAFPQIKDQVPPEPESGEEHPCKAEREERRSSIQAALLHAYSRALAHLANDSLTAQGYKILHEETHTEHLNTR